MTGGSWITPPPGIARCAVRVAAVILLAGYAWLGWNGSGRRDADFSHLWIGGRMVAVGEAAELYDPRAELAAYRRCDSQGRPPAVWKPRHDILGAFNYPPPAALGYAALAGLDPEAAAVLNLVATLALTVAAAWLTAALCGAEMSWAVAAVALMVHPAFFINLALGQNAVLTLVIMLGGWLLAVRGRGLLAGVVWGVLVFKPNMLLAVAWVPLLMRRWRMLAGLAGGAAAVCAGGALIVGLGPFVDYLALGRRLARMHELPGYHLYMQYSALAVARRWCGLGIAADCLGAAAGAAVLAWTARAVRWRWPALPQTMTLFAASAMAAGTWANLHLNHYDLLPVVPALLIGLQHRVFPGWLASVLLVGVYTSVPWDAAWSWGHVVPVPAVALVAVWLAVTAQLRRQRPATAPAEPEAPSAVVVPCGTAVQ